MIRYKHTISAAAEPANGRGLSFREKICLQTVGKSAQCTDKPSRQRVSAIAHFSMS
jgi:hypothetical protein